VLLDALPDAIVMVDTEGRIVDLNVHALGMFGYARADLLGVLVEILVPEGSRGRHVGQRTQYVEAPHVRPMGSGIELRGRQKDGQEFPIEVSLSPYQSPDGPLVVAAIRRVPPRRDAQTEE
jgi:PAS domain S-box-containing protein